jgi:hypothetical protein
MKTNPLRRTQSAPDLCVIDSVRRTLEMRIRNKTDYARTNNIGQTPITNGQDGREDLTFVPKSDDVNIKPPSLPDFLQNSSRTLQPPSFFLKPRRNTGLGGGF